MDADGKTRLAYLFHQTNHQPFGVAGVWETWKDPEAKDDPEAAVVESCAIITTEANAVMEPVHERMPVVLSPDNYDVWLDPASTDLEKLLVPCTEDDLT